MKFVVKSGCCPVISVSARMPLAAGEYLATGRITVVYMQNSGIGNAVNPILSLTNEKVYGIPCIFIVGWRGEPGVHDEPQHFRQGELTIRLLEDLGLRVYVIDTDTSEYGVQRELARSGLRRGKALPLW